MARSATTETKKKTRRGNGEGSIYQKPDGTWVAQALLGYRSDGKPVRKSFTGKTRREVASKLSAATTQVFQGSILAQPDKSFFEEFARYWLSVKRIEVTSRTLSWNNTMLSTYILPLIGGIPLCEVSVVHIQSIINNMAAKGLSHRTIKGVRDVLGQMMKFACRQRLISSNPVECVVIPKPQRKAGEDTTSKAIPIALRTEVLQAAQTEPLMKPIIITLMLTGLRPSEALALSWENVDMPRRILTVNQALTVAYDYDRFGNTSNKHTELGPPKTNAGYRKIAVPQAVINVIAEWKLYMLTLPKAEQMLDPKNAVFASTTTGDYRTYQGFRASYRHFLRRHNLDAEHLNLPRYRHTYATMLLEMGINPRVVQKLMGHSNISTTLGTYSHVVGEVYENVASGLETTFDKLMDGSYTPTMGTAEAASTAFRLLIGEK